MFKSTYTQYTGSSIVNKSLSTVQQNAAKAAIGEVFSDADITGYSCYSDSIGAHCYVGDFNCGLSSPGNIGCYDGAASEGCGVNADGSAYCNESGGGN